MYLGSRIQLTCTFSDFPTPPALVGSLGDPDAVALTITLGGVPVTSPSIVRDSVGQYHADFLPTIAGKYRALWAGTGGLSASDVFLFTVLPLA